MAQRPTKNITKAVPAAQSKPKERRPFPINIKLALLLGVCSFLVYANTLRNGFVLDDHTVIRDNRLVTQGIGAIPKLLATPYHYGWSLNDYDNLYRPLSLVLFATEYSIWELDPAPYHFIEILLFAGCVILLFFFLDRLLERKKTIVAFITALLFALHPIHTEVVANIKSCDELLCFFFAFLGLNLFLRYSEQGKAAHMAAGVLCFLASILSKETVITMLAVVPLIFFVFRNEYKKRSVHIILGAIGAFMAYLAIRYCVFSVYHTTKPEIDAIENTLAAPGLSYMSRIATAVLILGYYIKLLFIPYPLVCDYSLNSVPYAHFSDLAVIISLVLYVALAALMIYRFINNRKDPIAFGIFFYLVTIALFSNIPFLLGTTMGERLLFFPSVGFCLPVGFLIDKWAGANDKLLLHRLRGKKLLMILIPVCIIYAVITINRNADWVDNYTLYKTDLQKSPNDARLNQYVADILISDILSRETDPEKQKQVVYDAITDLRRALSIYPAYTNAESDLGQAYSDLGMYDSAEVHTKRAIQLDPKAMTAITNMSRICFNGKRYAEAIAYNKMEIRLDPKNPINYANTAACYISAGRPDSAIYYANAGVSADPRFIGSYELLLSGYKTIGNIDSVRKYDEIVQKIRALAK